MKRWAKALKTVSLVLIPTAVSIVLLAAYNKFLDSQIEKIYNPSISSIFGLEEKEKGLKLTEMSSKHDDLFMFGSSELSPRVPQSPQYMFPNTELNSNVNVVGMPRVQSLNDCLRLGGNAQSLKGKKVTILLSMQWFMGQDEAYQGYASHFSELQFYQFMKDSSIDADLKKRVCERNLELLPEKEQFFLPRLYSKLYIKDGFVFKGIFKVVDLYCSVRKAFLSLKDKHQAYKVALKHKNDEIKQPVELDWGQEIIKAGKLGLQSCTTNDVFISDEDWNGSVAGVYEKLKGAYANLNMGKAKEWEDLETLLRLCKNLELRPYIVVASGNGFYYDYTGLTRDKRVGFYDKIEKKLKSYDFDFLSLKGYEYVPYFYRDGMHLGWRGWTYVNKNITQHYCG